MVPWIFYLLCTIYFCSTVLQDGFADDGNLNEFIYKKLIVSIMSILIIWLITVEYLQICGQTERNFCSKVK